MSRQTTLAGIGLAVLAAVGGPALAVTAAVAVALAFVVTASATLGTDAVDLFRVLAALSDFFGVVGIPVDAGDVPPGCLRFVRRPLAASVDVPDVGHRAVGRLVLAVVG